MTERNRPERIQVPQERRWNSYKISRALRRNETDGKQLLWAALRNRKLDGYKFRPQQPVAGYGVDFYCAEHRLAIEVDGGVHATQTDVDADRQPLIETSGIRFVRLVDDLFRNDLQSALAAIRTAIVDPSSPSPLDGEGAGG